MGKKRAVQETRNYDRFECHPFNRDVKKTKHLERSMDKYGWLDAYPMHVVPNGNGKLKIVSGHHRYTAAMNLNMPVKFVIDYSGMQINIFELEQATNNWTLKNYLEANCRINKTPYMAVRDYHERTGIPLSTCISLLGPEGKAPSTVARMFKNGEFRVAAKTERPAIVEKIVSATSEVNSNVSTRGRYVAAVLQVLGVSEFDADRFVSQIRGAGGRKYLGPCVSVEENLRMIEDIYNYRRSDKVSIFFKARQAGK